MARRSSIGKYILSAGEIGAYTVCPEAWRLTAVSPVKTASDKGSSEAGQQLHQEWAAEYDEAVTLGRGIKIVIQLLMLAALVYLAMAQ